MVLTPAQPSRVANLRAVPSTILRAMDPSWVRLGTAVRDGRLALGIRRQVDMAERAGISRGTLSKIERGVPGRYDAHTQAGIERALGWKPGDFEQLLRSGRVSRVDDDLHQRLDALWPRISVGGRRAIVAAAEQLAR